VINFAEELRVAIDSIDPELHQFFGAVITSFIRLELVVLLRRNPGQPLIPSAISRDLGWPEDRVAEELAYLEHNGILGRCDDPQGDYRLSDDPRVSDLLNKFGFLYANRSSRLLILGHLLRQASKHDR
jgi:hypothetical protein